MAEYEYNKKVAEEVRKLLEDCPIKRGCEGMYIGSNCINQVKINPPWPESLDSNLEQFS